MRLRKRFVQSRRTYKDSTADESLLAERVRAYGKEAGLFDVKEDIPLVPKELHDLARHVNCRAIDPDEDFVAFDYHLCRLSHARTLVDLRLGELLSAFKKVHGDIGYSKIDDFADEHLSFSGRLAHEMILNYERLQALPLTREAYLKGEIVKSALRLVLRVMTKENEANLLDEIAGLSVREIEELVREKLQALKVCRKQKEKTGGDKSESVVVSAADGAAANATDILDNTESIQKPEEIPSEQIPSAEIPNDEMPSEEADRDEGSGVVMKFNVPRTLALTWDFALELYRENERTKGPVYGFVEDLVAGFMDSTADIAGSMKPKSSGTRPGAKTGAKTGAETGAKTGAETGAKTGAEPSAKPAAKPSAKIMTLFDPETASEDEPAFGGGVKVPLLYEKALWDDFPSEREMRARGKDCRTDKAGSDDYKSAQSGDEYPDPQNEERLKHIRETLSLKPFVVKMPESYSQIPSDPYELSHKIIRVAQMRQSIDYHIGWLLRAVNERHLFRLMEFSKIEDYAKARINISSSTTFRLIKLVSYFKNHPVIEKAFLKRKITKEQAFLIASLENGRHERIWLDFAMSRPTRELREEVNRMLRIKEYDYFAPHYYALLPGFRYITDDRYDGLSDEMREILRTGTWYKGPGSEWPIKIDDEYLLDKDFHNTVAFEMDTEQLSKCAADPDERADLPEANRLSKCATVQVEEADLSDRRSKCATDSGEEAGSTKSEKLSKCAMDLEKSSCKCREGHQHHYDEAIEEARALCTLPDKNRPAMTILLDVLDSLARQDSSGDEEVSSASGSHPARRSEPTMPIRFYLPSGLYGIWNDAVRRYTMLIPFEDGVELLVNNFGVENFMAILLTEYLLNEKAHHKAAHNNRVFERDGYKCQVPGCSNRRNIHSHHLEFRSHGGCDAQHNRLSLCAAHHLWILHILHGLKIEGTAPNELTFTFGPNSGPEGQPFMVYSSGRKVISPVAQVTRVIK